VKSGTTVSATNLLPLGLIMFAILSVPCIAAAWVGGWLGRRLGF
jgi:hypothetical protein